MKKATILATALIASSLAHGAFAGSESGFYVGGSVGSAKLSYSDADGKVNDSDTGYKVFGGYNFGLLPMVNLAIEGSYVDYGTLNGNILGEPIQFSNTALQAHLVGGLDLGPVGLFAKAGVSDWKTKFRSDFFSGSTSGSDPAYGIGAKFQLDAVQIRAEYERIKMDDADMDFYSLGAAYTF